MHSYLSKMSQRHLTQVQLLMETANQRLNQGLGGGNAFLIYHEGK